LESQINWVVSGQNAVQQGSIGAWCVSHTVRSLNRAEIGRELQRFVGAWNGFSSAVKTWTQKLQVDEVRYKTPLSDQSFADLHALWQKQVLNVNKLQEMVSVNQLIAQCEAEGLQALTPIALFWEPAATHLAQLFERAWLVALLDCAFEDRPQLASFDGDSHSKAVHQFQRLDLLQLSYNATLLAEAHAHSMPTGGGAGEIGVLWREFEKRARFLSIRNLMLKAGHAVQSIKPIFMMSPLSIANYLPPGSLDFDLVIFDEASQVKPVDALGAIARGKQVIVVGDSKQMPPTSFFDSMVAPEDVNEDEEDDDAADIESILGLFCAKGAQQRMLRWHYRSRHESLITPSNHLFYDDQLVVFPSPARERDQLGLVYRRLKTAYYERSRTRTNPVEAKTVAEAVMAHARSQLRLPRDTRDTLGVVAFSMSQMNAILEQVEIFRRNDPTCEEFFAYPPHEPFFVKNLENVQGDERDVIFISVGYGRTAEGFLAMNFGPLNRTGGERRLNVLISRARKRCEVFTNLSADDIALSGTSSTGVAALKTFLSYAETGQLDIPVNTGRPPDSEFEEQVLRRLQALGYEVHTQIGSAGFFLDLAVVDQDHPGRYLLGIECDGAAYHSALSARDRDRLRQAVLEGLGWRIHRIWSTDWFHNPEQELRKVREAIEAAKTSSPASPPPARPAEPKVAPVAESNTSAAEIRRQNVPVSHYASAQVSLRLNGTDMHLVERKQLASLIADVVKIESPVHQTEAARRILNGSGVQRMGTRIQQAFEEAVAVGVSRNLFVARNHFLWSRDMQEPPIRNRSKLPAACRKLEFVAPEEIRRAALIVVRESYGIEPSEVPAAVCHLLGFTRVTEEMSRMVEKHRDDLVRKGDLVQQGINLVAAAAEASR
jgi:very-short-patch-repair endonuclease